MGGDERQDEYDDFLPDTVRPNRPAAYEQDMVRHRGSRSVGLFKGLLGIVLLFLAVVGLNSTLFRIRSVRFEGLRTIKAEDVAREASLNREMGFFSVDTSAIKAAVERNPYLECQRVERRLPSSLIIHVKERSPCANVRGGGAFYIIDENANVLSFINASASSNSLPDVIGISVRDARLGQLLNTERPEKIEEYKAIIEELLLQGVVNSFSSIDISDSSHIYLTSREGFIADIGTCSELLAKIATLRGVISSLVEMGYNAGMIDVSIPGEATFSPQ